MRRTNREVSFDDDDVRLLGFHVIESIARKTYTDTSITLTRRNVHLKFMVLPHLCTVLLSWIRSIAVIELTIAGYISQCWKYRWVFCNCSINDRILHGKRWECDWPSCLNIPNRLLEFTLDDAQSDRQWSKSYKKIRKNDNKTFFGEFFC